MYVVKLKSPVMGGLTVLLAALAVSFALFRLETVWTVESAVVVEGGWGTAEGEFGRTTGVDGRLRGPQALAVDGAGNVAVADSVNGRVQVFSQDGEFLLAFGVPADGPSGAWRGDRVAAYGLLQPCLAWGSGFRPRPELPAPVGVCTVPGTDDVAVSALTRGPYVTDIDLGPGSWHPSEARRGHAPETGPKVYLLAGWDGVLLAVGPAGRLEWRRDLLDLGLEGMAAGYVLDADAAPGGGVVFCGYGLFGDHLVYFVRLVRPDAEPLDLARYRLDRDGSVTVADDPPIKQEIESLAVGEDGRLYAVAAPGSDRDPEGAGHSPFTREVWVYSPDGRLEGSFGLDCETYTRYLEMIGVDRRGLVYVRQRFDGVPGCLGVFDSRGRPVAWLPTAEEVESADAYVRDGFLYLSEADDEGFRVSRYRVEARTRLRWRWSGPAEEPTG